MSIATVVQVTPKLQTRPPRCRRWCCRRWPMLWTISRPSAWSGCCKWAPPSSRCTLCTRWLSPPTPSGAPCACNRVQHSTVLVECGKLSARHWAGCEQLGFGSLSTSAVDICGSFRIFAILQSVVALQFRWLLVLSGLTLPHTAVFAHAWRNDPAPAQQPVGHPSAMLWVHWIPPTRQPHPARQRRAGPSTGHAVQPAGGAAQQRGWGRARQPALAAGPH